MMKKLATLLISSTLAFGVATAVSTHLSEANAASVGGWCYPFFACSHQCLWFELCGCCCEFQIG